MNLTDDEIAQVELTPAGWGIKWSDDDLDFWVNELVQGVFGTKTMRFFRNNLLIQN
jgi:hypothetical protein